MSLSAPISRDALCDRTEAAEILGVHPNTIDRMGRDKVLRRYRIRGVHGRIFYMRDEVAGCIEEIEEAVS